LCLSGTEQEVNASFTGSPNPKIFDDGFEGFPITEDDGDATIIDEVGVEPTSIDSMHSTPFVVLDFRIVDGGFSDGRTTELTGLLVRQGGNADASGHSWFLAGDDINGSVAGVVAGFVGNQTISFDDLTISVPDGGSQTYTLSLKLGTSTANIQDKDLFLVAISGEDATLGDGTRKN